jgi:AraC family transcriptional regulator of arabinose operon
MNRKRRRKGKVVIPVIRLRPVTRPGLIADDRVILAGCMPEKQMWVHHTFSEFAIGFVTSGRGSYQIDDRPVQRIEAGCLFHVYPGPIFHYGPDPGTMWCEYHFGLDGPRFQQFRKAGLFATDGRVQPLNQVTSLIVHFRDLIETVKRAGPGDSDRAVLMAERLLAELYYSRVSLQTEQTPSKPIEAILRHCQEHLSTELDFEALAAAHAMSYSSLRQSFRKVTGSGPAHYVTGLRCDRARALLAETGLSIKEIGTKIGIDDPYTFSRIFKRSVGIAPREYRRQARVWSGGAR